ncbi:hypothetical protein J3R04_003884 [Spirilliplanes yamanashiensis]|nr:hypothetical protein [Spirilliplanes yamanashiensis]
MRLSRARYEAFHRHVAALQQIVAQAATTVLPTA